MRAAALFVLLACATGQAKPAEPKEPPAAFTAACVASCQRQNMMRAVGAELIEAECKQDCAADWQLPAVRDAKALAKLVEARVRVYGKLAGEALVLADGAKLALAGPALAEAKGLEGQPVVVIATAAKGALEMCTTLASAR